VTEEDLTDVKADMIEGSTDLNEAVGKAIERIFQLEDHVVALKARIEEIEKRKGRFEDQVKAIREHLLNALQMAELNRLEFPFATITRKAVPGKLVVTNEQNIPVDYWVEKDPVLDRNRLTKDLRDGKIQIEGAEIGPKGETVSIKGT
jgi:hypothetical protein